MNSKKDNSSKLALFVTVIIALIITVTIYNNKKTKNSSYEHPTVQSEVINESIPADTISVIKSLKSYNGKYASNSGFFDEQIISERLIVLIGKERFEILKEKWNTESPIELNNQLLIATGCQAHNCDKTNFIIIIDTKNDVFYAGINLEGKSEVLSENGINLEQLNTWRIKNTEIEEEIILDSQFSSLVDYYEGVSTENFDAYSYFSPQVSQYITLKNVNPNQINNSFEHDKKEYTNQKFEYDTSDFILNYTENGIRYYSFLLKCKCFRNSKQLNQESEIRTEVGFDTEGKIYSLKYPKVEYSRYY